MIKNFMPHRDGFPVSRDWEDIDCHAVYCVNNILNCKCSVSSLAKIGEDGQCKGFRDIRLEDKQ